MNTHKRARQYEPVLVHYHADIVKMEPYFTAEKPLSSCMIHSAGVAFFLMHRAE